MELTDFLVQAKINTYAGAGEGGEGRMSDGCKELVYKEGEWSYRDRYFGGYSFAGQEMVWQSNRPVWAMNYYGTMLSEEVDIGECVTFLKSVLKKITPARPYRGPASYQRENWLYKNTPSGSIDYFSGQESIFFRETKVYELVYHGGFIER